MGEVKFFVFVFDADSEAVGGLFSVVGFLGGCHFLVGGFVEEWAGVGECESEFGEVVDGGDETSASEFPAYIGVGGGGSALEPGLVTDCAVGDFDPLIVGLEGGHFQGLGDLGVDVLPEWFSGGSLDDGA